MYCIILWDYNTFGYDYLLSELVNIKRRKEIAYTESGFLPTLEKLENLMILVVSITT